MEQSSVFHLQGDLVDPTVLKQREDLLGTTSSSALGYLTLDGWRRQMVGRGEELLGAAIARAQRVREAVAGMTGLRLLGREVVGHGLAFDLDPLAITVDVRELGVTGFRAGDWLRAARQVDMGAADTCRVNARLTHADDDETERRLVDALRRPAAEADSIERPPHGQLPQHPDGLELESVLTPRDALLNPYPPGVPVLAPGERISQEALDHLTTGVAAGMIIPDAADPSMQSVRVVAR